MQEFSSNFDSLYELFDTINAENILGFIRDIGLCHFVQLNLFICLISFIPVSAIVLKPIVNT